MFKGANGILIFIFLLKKINYVPLWNPRSLSDLHAYRAFILILSFQGCSGAGFRVLEK